MRSIFAKILIWTFGTLILSLVAFVAISLFLSHWAMERADIFRKLASMEMEESIWAYESGGTVRLAGYLGHLRRFFPRADHILTDASGRDLATGQDRSDLAAYAGPNWRPHYSVQDNRLVIGTESTDHRYRFLAIVTPPVSMMSFAPYYLLILVAVGGLSYLLAVNLATPLRVLAEKVEQFGRGDLSVRMQPRRNDEIGELGRAFDQMADRIQTLLTAERRLLQDISHELRSPLARLSFATELVRTAEDRDAAVTRLRKEVTRLTSLVSSLLEVTRAEGDPAERSTQAVSLNALLGQVVEDCRIEADARHCRVSLRAQPAEVRGDAELLRRAFENVLRNAIRHAPEDSDVAVDLVCGDAAKVTIRDYGQGVPDALLASIFQPFFRVEAARENATGGTGLGLAIARRAIMVHNGAIWAESAHPGLLVHIELPVLAACLTAGNE